MAMAVAAWQCEKGNLIDGDKIMAALAVDMKEKNELPGDAVVVASCPIWAFSVFVNNTA